MITITKAGNLVKIDHEGGTTWVAQNDRPYFRLTGTDLTFRVGEVRIDQKPLSSFSIGGVTPANESQLQTQLAAVFPNPGSGSGSTTPQVLQSPDGTLWLVGVNDSGALQTTQTAAGTPGTLHLFSPDNTEWNVTVSNAGALATTPV